MENFRSTTRRLSKKMDLSTLFSFLIITICVYLIMGLMINRTAYDPEALVNYKYMRELSIWDFWTGETLPGHVTATYRPVLGTLLKSEFLLFGFNPPIYFLVNVLLVLTLAFMAYKIVLLTTLEPLPALVAVLLFITDWRLSPNIYVIGEVQITLAGVFGLSALLILWFGKGKKQPISVFILLLLSALSKEFGLAFSLAVFMDALLNKREGWKRYIWLTLGVVAFYVGMRLLIGVYPISTRSYPSFTNRIKWLGMNISSGFIFSFFNLFRPVSDGDLPSMANLRYSLKEAGQIILWQIIPLFAFFLLGFKNKNYRKYSIPLLFLLLGNSLLFFWRYAFRFHFLGNISMYMIAGFGIDYVIKKLGSDIRLRNLILILFLFFGSILYWRGAEFRDYLDKVDRNTNREKCYESGYSKAEIQQCLKNRSLCIPTQEYYQQDDFLGYYTKTDPETILMVMEYYQMPIETCTCLNPNPSCP